MSVMQIAAVIGISCCGAIWSVKIFRWRIGGLSSTPTTHEINREAPTIVMLSILATTATVLGIIVVGVVTGLLALILLQVIWVEVPDLLETVASWPW